MATPTDEHSAGDTHGLYIHVPFCITRCGYCDFNTYTPGEEGTSSVEVYLESLERELDQAAIAWDRPGPPSTVFLGGGTPSLLGAAGLIRVLDAVRRSLGLADGAEVTTEANPESTSPQFFAALRDAGFTRVSLGMQSASAHVLQILERRHTPGRALEAALEAQAAGFEHVNLDLIYGTPMETNDDLQRSVDAALSTGVDHISAYSLIVEDGTAMARKVRTGQLREPEEDVYADRYEMIDAALKDAGMRWYEVSNWARPGGECRHNLVYWRGGQWWGAGPGAHGCIRLTSEAAVLHGANGAQSKDSLGVAHKGTTRLVNAKLPRRYAEALAAGSSPVTGVEILSADDVHTERVMTGMRLAEGLLTEELSGASQTITRYIALGLVEQVADRTRLTDAGRLLADGIITDFLVEEDAGR